MSAQPAPHAVEAPPAAPAVPDIVFEHLEETAFLGIQRRRLLFSPELPLEVLRRLDQRLEAHRDGLRLGGATTLRLAEANLEGDDAWLVAAAARVWLEFADADAPAVCGRIAAGGETLLPAWCEALRRMDDAAFERLFLRQATAPSEPVPAAAVIDARGWRGVLEPAAAVTAARSEHAGLRRAAARHVRDAEAARALAGDPDPGVRERALWSLALAEPAIAVAQARRGLDQEPDGIAIRVLGLFGERADGERLAALLQHPRAARPAIAALLDLGIPAFARPLLAVMDSKDEDMSAAAREAFESLLGPVPAADDEHPLPPHATPETAHWDRVGAKAERGERRLRGTPLAWAGDPRDEPMERLWRRALAKPSKESVWLRREVPDGWFDGIDPFEALPGV